MSAATGNPAAPMLRRLPFSVRLTPSFLSRVPSLKAPEASTFAVHGVLFGTIEANAVVVRIAEPFPIDLDDAALDAFLTLARKDLEDADVAPIGWYSVRADKKLLKSDCEIHSRHFSHASNLLMTIRKGRNNAGTQIDIYCRSSNGELTSKSHRFGATSLPGNGHFDSPLEVDLHPRNRDELYLRNADDANRTPHNAGRWRKPAESLAVVFIFVVALLLTYFVAHRLHQARSSHPASSAVPLGLHLNQMGKQVSVFWDRGSPPMRNASGGTLLIRDGGHNQELVLSRGQLRGGSLLYVPASSDVTFRLTVKAADGSATSEVLQLSPPAVLPPAALPPENHPEEASSSTIPSSPAPVEPRPQRLPRPVAKMIPPKPVTQVLPDTSHLSPDLLRSPKQVTVLVRVESDGHVTRAEALHVTAANSGLVTSALAAARRWVFTPASSNGRPVPGQHTIIFNFQSRN